MDRREFLRTSLAGGAGLAALRAKADVRPAGRPRARGVIWIWTGGGMSQIDTFDPKPGHKNGGEFKAIDTTVPEIQFTELLPACAAQMKHLAIIRSMRTMEGAHNRGTYLMHTGFPPVPGVDYPSFGSVVAHELGRLEPGMPRFLAFDPPLIPSSPVFGEECRPFRVNNVDNPISNIRSLVDANRDRERRELLREELAEQEKVRGGELSARFKAAAAQAERLMRSPLLKAFDYREEPEAVRLEYGDRFGINCLVARRLVEAGCPFVEIGFGGWDTHGDIFGSYKRMVPTLDRGLGGLVKDLAQRGLLRDVLVVLAGQFGKTPDINAGKGRDHWANGFTVVLAGAGLKGGVVYGSTGPDGHECNDPVSSSQLFTTIHTALGIDPHKSFGVSAEASRDTYTWPRAEPIKELLRA
jgi:hypothetical protein